MVYGEVYVKLLTETATVVFFKANGDIRVMLATRNTKTVSLFHGANHGNLDGHDKRCNIKNGNIAVMDLILGEPRSFNIDRLVSIQFHGVIDTQEKVDRVYNDFKAFETEYLATKPQKISMDLLT